MQVVAHAILVLSGCSSQEPMPPSAQTDTPLVLYLREAVPEDGTTFGRVTSTRQDLGSMSTIPPPKPENRLCGDVVAFDSVMEAPAEGLHVREVAYQLWWFAGSGRGGLSLNAPGLPEGFAQLPISSDHPEPAANEQGYWLVDARVPVDVRLSPEQLTQLYLTLDTANATVKVATCPARLSTVVLNPAPATANAAFDPSSPACLQPLERDPVPPRTEPRPVPEPERELGLRSVEGELVLTDEVVIQRGDLSVVGTLRLDGATLILAPDPATGRAARVEIERGATLEVLADSLITAPDPNAGYHIHVSRDTSLRMEDSTVQLGGAIRTEADGRLLPTRSALWLESPRPTVQGCSFLRNLVALEIETDSAQIASNHFEGNATAIQGRMASSVVRGNDSYRDGTFLLLDDGSQSWWIEGNQVEHQWDYAVWARAPVEGHRIVQNRFIDGYKGISVAQGSRDLQVSGNELTSCVGGLEIPHDPSHRIEDNRVGESSASACRGAEAGDDRRLEVVDGRPAAGDPPEAADRRRRAETVAGR